MKPLSTVLLPSEKMKAGNMVVVGSLAHSHPHTHSGRPSSMESDLLMYKQKMEQMSMLIKHYQNELESQKVRRDGVETVSRLLTEARQENVALKKQLAASQMIVKNLHNRMTVSGMLPGRTEDESGGGDNEVLIPSTSRQTLTNLVLENRRLRALLQEDSSAGDNSTASSGLSKAAQDMDNRNSLPGQTLEQLEADNHSMRRKLSDLEALFKSSNNDKDRQLLYYQHEIQRLTLSLKQQSSSSSSSSSSWSSSSAPQTKPVALEVLTLKEQLRALMNHCASFETHLDSMWPMGEGREAEQENKDSVELMPVSSKQAAERTDTMDGVDVKQLLEDKRQLQTRVDEVLQMNQRWQEFSSERAEYTRSLEQQLRDLEGQLKQVLQREATPEANQHVQSVIEQAQKELQIVDDRRRKAEEEAAALHQEKGVRDAQLQQLQTQVTMLTQTVRQHTTSDAQGTIDHLKAQIQVCTEDFEKERQDRQIALKKVTSLQEQVMRLQRLNNHFQTLLGQTTRPVQEHGHIDMLRHQQHSGSVFGQTGLAYDSPAFSGSECESESVAQLPGVHMKASGIHHLHHPQPGPMSLPAASSSSSSSQLLSPRGMMHRPLSDSSLGKGGRPDSVLTCPKCNKEYSEEHQEELLAHMDVCWE